MQPAELKNGDTDDLEALFDSIAAQRVQSAPPVAAVKHEETLAEAVQEHPEVLEPGDPSVKEGGDNYDVFHRIGALTRNLHDALHQLGYDKSVESAVGTLPDARARLAYIANLTGQAAEKVLAAVEVGQEKQDAVQKQAQKLNAQWDRLFNKELTLEEFKAHALETHAFLKEVSTQAGETNGIFTQIMLAQDFHDLTGQVINRIASMAQNLEEQLVQLLLDTTPADRRQQVDETWLSGPVINGSGRTDVCVNQTQVDDLLESLGF